MKCANCPVDSTYEYRLTQEKSIFYCTKHIPSFLKTAVLAGLLPKTESFTAALEEGLKNITVVPEEIVAEPETIPTPTSKKKPTKKAATKNAPNS